MLLYVCIHEALFHYYTHGGKEEERSLIEELAAYLTYFSIHIKILNFTCTLCLSTCSCVCVCVCVMRITGIYPQTYQYSGGRRQSVFLSTHARMLLVHPLLSSSFHCSTSLILHYRQLRALGRVETPCLRGNCARGRTKRLPSYETSQNAQADHLFLLNSRPGQRS